MEPETIVPPFTGLVDAAVPAENVILSHYVAERQRWIAFSEASDGRVFLGHGATEPLARRAAGLRTLAHLEQRATAGANSATPEEIEAAKRELACALSKLRAAVQGHNGTFPESYSRAAVLIELQATEKMTTTPAKRTILARVALPALTFLAGAFAEGVVGALAEQALGRLEALLGM